MNRRNRGGQKNRKINRITARYSRNYWDLFDHVRYNKHGLVIQMHRNNIAEEFTVSKPCYCLWTSPVYVHTDLVARQTRRDPWKSLQDALLSGRPKVRVCWGLKPQTVSHVDPLLMVHVMGFPRALAAVARLPESTQKEIKLKNLTQSTFRASVDVTSTFL